MNNDIIQKNNIMIVTAFYTIPSKFPKSQYYEWMENFLSIPCNLFIFCDNENYNNIKKLREQHKNTFIQILPIENFHTYKYMNYWNYCYSIDKEKNHSPYLYMIWNEKSFFVSKAIDINPFNVQYVWWQDIGSVRYKNNIPYNFPNIPNSYHDKMMCISIDDIIESDKKFTNYPLCDIFLNINEKTACNPIVRIEGGFFGGHINVWKKWITLYDEMLNYFIKYKYFGGKDQYIMTNLCIIHNDITIVLKAQCNFNNNNIDPWWWFLYEFS